MNGDDVIVAGAGESIEGRAWLTRMVPKRLICAFQSMREDWVSVQKKD
jgi:hypothetical protein